MATVQDELTFVANGRTHRPVMIRDDTADTPRPTVMVCGTILGRNAFALDRARALQQLGYVGVALDLYGEGFNTTDVDAARVHMNTLKNDRKELHRRLAVSLDFIGSQPQVDATRLAVIGYCFGGLCALDVARTRDDVRAVASFHGLLGSPPEPQTTPITAKVLVLHGDEDPLAPPDHVEHLREELTRRQADWQIHIYGSVRHSFAVPGANAPERGLKYNAHAQRRSWASLLDFLKESL